MKAKRILASVVACLVLILSMTVIASAEGTATELPAAVDGVITLTQDVTLAQKVVIDESVTIEGNDFTLTYTGTDRAITVENTDVADLTINDLNVVCSANSCQRGINYNTTGKLTLNNVSVSGKKITYGVNLPGSADGAIVNIADSDVTALVALNVWGENAIINVTNTDLTSVDANADEDYTAISLNNDGITVADGTQVNVTGGSITAKNEKGEASIAVMDNTKTGSVTISDATVVTGSVEKAVAIIAYDSIDEIYACTTLEEAIAGAGGDADATVKLISDVELTETIALNKPIKIDGEGHKIKSSAKKLFEVYADFEVYDLKMETTHPDGRCVDTRVDNITVTIDNCELKTLAGTSTAQCVNIGGYDLDGLNVTIIDSTIESEYAGVILWVPADVTIENSNITAWATIYAKGPAMYPGAFVGESSGSVIKVMNSDLKSVSDHSGASDIFAAIAIEDDDVTVTIDADSTVTVDAKGTACQSAVLFNKKDSAVTLNGAVELNGPVTTVVSHLAADSELVVTNPDVIEAVKAEGYDVADNGAVTAPEVRWVEDTDAGFYLDGETKLGLLRFLFAVDINEEIQASGIKYIKPSDIAEGQNAQGVQVDGAAASVFYGDINGIPATEEGKRLIAIAYVTTANGTYWSNAIEGVVDMTSQQFTDYNAGGAQ